MADDVGLDALQWFRAYGLLFASSIEIPEMLPAGELPPGATPDVVVARASFDNSLVHPIATSDVHQVDHDTLLLRVADVGRFLVSNGRQILFDPDPAATAHDVRVYLLGTCLGALLHQRGFYVLHASGIRSGRAAVLFTGDSGAGKSTLLGELLRRGFPMVVDDVCAVRFDGDTPIVVPSYPRTRLWADAASRLSVDTTALPRTRSSWDKFERQVTEQFSDVEVGMSHVFQLALPRTTGCHRRVHHPRREHLPQRPARRHEHPEQPLRAREQARSFGRGDPGATTGRCVHRGAGRRSRPRGRRRMMTTLRPRARKEPA
jgi:hypothetical protein